MLTILLGMENPINIFRRNIEYCANAQSNEAPSPKAHHKNPPFSNVQQKKKPLYNKTTNTQADDLKE